MSDKDLPESLFDEMDLEEFNPWAEVTITGEDLLEKERLLDAEEAYDRAMGVV